MGDRKVAEHVKNLSVIRELCFILRPMMLNKVIGVDSERCTAFEVMTLERFHAAYNNLRDAVFQYEAACQAMDAAKKAYDLRKLVRISGEKD